ncbi:hypothetical protein RFI_05833 [Reticulomyxa filosa]|uniref:B-block binding subunit of TFIIIC domain-containing protein n=1 Tax=Reticulomyxa filosa TaxID=46433 RepID=X6P164_RETFI|nr:hypothetical protein RFI_05833 [Reticulomyxa filosa]|eukprot:ETO31287.1 hypothetical protein RFI_05833 [Reticulomyxa filosa]
MSNFEGQALNIAPEYYYSERTFTLTNTDDVLRYIIQYITSCGCHGACFTQICVALEQVYEYQQGLLSISNESSYTQEIGARVCQYSHEPFKDRFGEGIDKKVKSENILIYGYLFGEWIIYLNNVMGGNPTTTKKWLPNSTNKKTPFQLYEMNITNQNKSSAMETGQEVEATKDGVKYPCMKYRTKYLNVSWLKQMYNAITKKCDAQHIVNQYMNVFDTIYFVSEPCHSTIQTCVLELLMRAGVQGIAQSDLANELNVPSKEIFQILKQFHHFNLIVKCPDPVYSRRSNHVWLRQFVCNKVIVRYMKWSNESNISKKTLELRNLYRTNQLNECKTLRLLPFSHCFNQCVRLQCADNCNLYSQKIKQDIVPYLYSVLTSEEYRINGVACDSLKKMASQRFQWTDHDNIPWKDIQEVLIQTYPHQLEITRHIYSNNVIQAAIRLKPSNNANEKVKEGNDIVHPRIGHCWDMSRTLQLYNKIFDSGIKGIVSTDLSIQLQIPKKDLAKLLNYCVKTFDITRTIDTPYKSTTYRYFAKQHFQALAQINSNIKKAAKETTVPSKRNSKKTRSSPHKSRQAANTDDNTQVPQIKIENETADEKSNLGSTRSTGSQAPKSLKFLNRREQMLDYLKKNNGMAAALELRRYLQSLENGEEVANKTALLDGSVFSRLTKDLCDDELITIVNIKNSDGYTALIVEKNVDVNNPDVQQKIKQCVNFEHRSVSGPSSFVDMTNTSRSGDGSTSNVRAKEVSTASEEMSESNINKDKCYSYKYYFYGFMKPFNCRVWSFHEWLYDFYKQHSVESIQAIQIQIDLRKQDYQKRMLQRQSGFRLPRRKRQILLNNNENARLDKPIESINEEWKSYQQRSSRIEKNTNTTCYDRLEGRYLYHFPQRHCFEAITNDNSNENETEITNNDVNCVFSLPSLKADGWRRKHKIQFYSDSRRDLFRIILKEEQGRQHDGPK